MALEDAVVLGELFSQMRSKQQIQTALQAYDATRRPRAQHTAASSRLTGKIMTGLVEQVRTDPEKLHGPLKDRWDYIYKF